MRRIIMCFWVCLLCLFVLPLQASAQAMQAYTCTPNTFSLTRAGVVFDLDGNLEMPTPGYTYDFGAPTTLTRSHLRLPLTFNRPKGIEPMHVVSLHIHHSFEAEPGLSRLDINIQKTFNMGPEKISCYVGGK